MKTTHQIYKTLFIDIAVYKPISKTYTYKINHMDKGMNNAPLDTMNQTQNKFICSICLNQKYIDDDKESEFNERKSKSCPICQCSCSWSTNGTSSVTKGLKQSKNKLTNDIRVTKDVQTSHADVTQGLCLLNEVLNVFQTKKQLSESKERKSKTLIFKDVGVLTEDRNYRKENTKLSRSKVFHCSIEDKTGDENKFTIVTACQPESISPSHKSLDLIKHKSSSIPQMKLEELKKSLKKKTKSKDVIEEANRIFATMKRVEEKESDENRPMIRNGPRVLPVVKTGNFDNQNSKHYLNTKKDLTCKLSQENNYNMSGGDSTIKNKCCHNCTASIERCDDCVYMMCCHHQKNRQLVKELICKRCRVAKQEG